MRLLATSVIILAVTACKTGADSAAVKDESGTPDTSSSPAETPATAEAAEADAAAAMPALMAGEKIFVDADGKDEDFWIAELMKESDSIVAGLKQSTGKARRSAHSKAHGCVRGTFTPDPSRPAEARVGVFAQDVSHPVWLRFSNATPRLQPDLVPDARGMAMKIINVDGAKLLPGHENSNNVDFAFVNSPVFPVANVEEYMGLEQNTAKFIATHKRPAFIVAEQAANLMSNPLKGTYWSMGAYSMDDKAVKFSTRPCAPVAPLSKLPASLHKHFLREAMITQLQDKKEPACFVFGVQFQKDPDSMPVEDPSVEWRESLGLISKVKRAVTGKDPSSPFVPIAKITIDPQTFATSEQDDFCERLSYNPWRTLAVHHPLGNLMRARRKVYVASLRQRMGENKTTQVSDVLTGTAADVTPSAP